MTTLLLIISAAVVTPVLALIGKHTIGLRVEEAVETECIDQIHAA